MNTRGATVRFLDLSKKFLEHRHLPAILAIVAVLVMMPALKLGLAADDLPQRVIALRPDQLPPHVREVGAPADTGSLPTVLREFFYNMNPQSIALAKRCGMLPWWVADDLRLGLFRPVTAFTHWLDYRLYPGLPAVMHAQNIAWFAAVVFLVTIICRKLMGSGWPAGLAALMFLLDGNTYFPVAFVANRGFIMALFFGLASLYEHHQWRSAKAGSGLWLSALFLALALFANEGGASTFAFILAYALVLDTGTVGRRALTVLPAILVIVLWRIIHNHFTSGIFHMRGYIDPTIEPLQFLRLVMPRAVILLGGQLTSVTPELMMALSPSTQQKVMAFYAASVIAAVVVFLPWVRRDRTAAFWFTVMMLAVIPAATVIPISKNLGFVAVGAYGFIASFVAGLTNRQARLPDSPIYRVPAWTACLLLILAHVPGAIVGRAAATAGTALAFQGLDYLSNVGDSRDLENENVVVINAPSQLPLAYASSRKVYHCEPVPKSIRTLVPGCTGFQVERTDEFTLVVQSFGPDIFSCDDVGMIHVAYAFRNGNVSLGEPVCTKGQLPSLGGMTVDILQLDSSNLPSRVAFKFDASLDSPDFHWLMFDWRTFSYAAFKIPAVGQKVALSGPHK
jgi:hypothetical protein